MADEVVHGRKTVFRKGLLSRREAAGGYPAQHHSLALTASNQAAHGRAPRPKTLGKPAIAPVFFRVQSMPV
jgi:hypothetical protein